ncbi:DUF3558 family protein [Amycolatopsis taiwanensis]|uniref:DUF3558 domain-containing protein n=1 Tax=Amycolatopsis taiwanensis TaxID=342230 RepID=A0A9W6QU20_9PSEU|nr:DUF3558 family protein [Amycolatopsis taiwanensis]GLY64031.1 hypothetical protein Atai01_06500 [Amycolatopsis taiwanensis]
MKGRFLVPLVALLLGGCTVAVTGTPLSATSTDPCSLLTDTEAASLGLRGPGNPNPAQPQLATPPSCTWSSANPDATYDGTLQAFYSTDISIEKHYLTAPAGVERLGGVAWNRYLSPVGDFICDLAVKISDTSFVALSSQSLANPAKACDLAEQAAPVVAGHLPLPRGER